MTRAVAYVTRLAAVEELRGRGSIGIVPVRALEHPQRHQPVEEIARPAGMQFKPPGHFLGGQRLLSENREDIQVDGGEQRLGAPEGKPELENRFRRNRRNGLRLRYRHESLAPPPRIYAQCGGKSDQREMGNEAEQWVRDGCDGGLRQTVRAQFGGDRISARR
jgi:hypothetical protein